MKLREALIFCNEAEKVTTRKKTLTLLDALVICEKFNRRVGKKTQKKSKNSDKQEQNQPSVANDEHPQEETPQEIVIGEKTYKVMAQIAKGSYETRVLNSVDTSANGMNHYVDFENKLKKRPTIRTSVKSLSGEELIAKINAEALKDHIENKVDHKGKLDKKEQAWRKIIVGYFWMTLEDPQEVWVNNGRNDKNNRLSYVFIKQFRANTPQGIKDMVVVVIVNGYTLQVTTYYAEKENPIDLYERRWGYLIYKK